MLLQRRSATSVALPLFLLALSAALLFLYGVATLLGQPAGHDQKWYLFAAQRLLSGAELYGPYLSETNPPLIIWFSVLPVILANLLHASSVLTLRLLVLAMILVSVAWCVRLLCLSNPAGKRIFVAFIACAIVFIEFDTGSYNFGQREQLVVILAVPYIFAAASETISLLTISERCILGMAAGVAICFKPQQAFIFIGLELFLAIYHRSARRITAPDVLALFLTVGIYVVLIRTVTPLYFSHTLPLLVDTYWAYGTSSAIGLARSQEKLMLAVLAGLVGCVALRRFLHEPVFPVALLICSLASSLSFDLQRTGWEYQRYPSRAFCLLAAFCLLIEIVEPVLIRWMNVSSSHFRLTFVASGALLLTFWAITMRYPEPGDTTATNADIDDFLEQFKRGTTVYIFSTSVIPFSKVFEHNLGWGSRFPALWMLPAIVENEEGPTSFNAPFKKIPLNTLVVLSDLQRTQIADDLNYWRPSVVLVEHCTVDKPCQAMNGKNFDTIAWFIESHSFSDAWSHYQKKKGLSSFDVFSRIDDSPPTKLVR